MIVNDPEYGEATPEPEQEQGRGPAEAETVVMAFVRVLAGLSFLVIAFASGAALLVPSSAEAAPKLQCTEKPKVVRCSKLDRTMFNRLVSTVYRRIELDWFIEPATEAFCDVRKAPRSWYCTVTFPCVQTIATATGCSVEYEPGGTRRLVVDASIRRTGGVKVWALVEE